MITEIEKLPNVKFTCIGGTLNRLYGFFMDPYIAKQLSTFNCAFFGMVGLSEKGTMEMDSFTADFKKLAAKQSDKVIVLSDHNKIQQSSRILSIPSKLIDYIITDTKPKSLEKITLYDKIIEIPLCFKSSKRNFSLKLNFI